MQSEQTTTPEWVQKRQRRSMMISASQLEAFADCPRKWWMEKIRKLPVIQKGSFSFGTVLHAVAERWLRADDQGYDQNGQPVNLYPVGWEFDGGDQLYPGDFKKLRTFMEKAKWMSAEARRAINNRLQGDLVSSPEDQAAIAAMFEEHTLDSIHTRLIKTLMDSGDCVSPDEQVIIQKLIESAIENGTLQRLPGRKIEEQFTRKMIVSESDTTVSITGYIDVSYDDRVEDHKTTKSMRWAKTPKTLRENLQVHIYAMQKILQAQDEGREVPDAILVRHNIFVKDPKALKVKHVEVELTREEIEKTWSKLLKDAEQMSFLRDSIENWHEIHDPVDNRVCNKYGGCPFMTICGGTESLAGYESRVDNAKRVAHNITQQVPLTLKGSDMSNAFTAKLGAKMAANGTAAPVAAPAPAPAAAAAPVAAAPVAPAPAPAPAAAPVAAAPAAEPAAAPTNSPPWANPNCTACKGAGFNSQGSPCRICDATASKQGKPPSSSFDITTANGQIQWAEKGTAQAGTSPSASTDAPVAQAQQTAATQAPAPAPAPAPAVPVAAPAAQPAEAAAPAAAAPAAEPEQPAEAAKNAKGGRPKKGFILCINCTPNVTNGRKGSGRGVTHLSHVLKELQDSMCAVSGVASFYDLDVWDRRAKLAQTAEALAEEFGTDIVVATGVHGESDLKSLVDALRPFAGMEILSLA